MVEPKPCRRIGVLGGTFDPVHLAHIELAKRTIEQCQLSELVFVPCSQPPHRSQAQASDQQRYEMLMLAIEDMSHVSICDHELTKSSISFTVETLEFLAKNHPDAQLVFCLGGDSLRDFVNWHRWQDILSIAHLAVIERPINESENSINSTNNEGDKNGLLEQKIESIDQMNKNAGQIIEIDAPSMQVSATLIRERIQQCAKHAQTEFQQGTILKDPILDSWLDAKVLNYIVNNKVYQ